MLRIRKLKMEVTLILHVAHVTGSRMIAEGGDGGSRGDLIRSDGRKSNPVDYIIPLHVTVFERPLKPGYTLGG
jgi:hypothetical protein